MIKHFDVSSPKFKGLYERHRYKVFYSGRASGKSWALAQAAVYYMFTTRVRILSCRMHMNSIRESNHKLIVDTISRMGLEKFFDIGQYEIKCIKTGSTMFFKGLSNNFSSLKSIEDVGICLVDEAESITEEAWSFLIPTIRAKGSEIWVSFNPRLVTDATWQRFVLNPPEDSVVVKLNIDDNPFLSPEILQEMEHDKKTDPIRYQWIWLGEPMGSESNTFISPILISDARKRIVERNESLQIVAGLDVSTVGQDWTVLIRRRGFEILSIHKMQKGEAIDVENWVKNIYTSHGWDKIIIDTTNESGIGGHIEQWGNANRTFETVLWKASRSPRNKSKYANARAESWGLMRDWLEYGQLTNDKEWDELPKVLYKFTTKEQIQLQSKKELSKSPDFGDALAISLWQKDEPKVIKQVEQPIWNAPVNEYQFRNSTWAG